MKKINTITNPQIWVAWVLTMLYISAASAQTKSVLQYVNPFIGAADNGHTFPGATVPFGMIQASPETGNCGWNYCSGYRYEDKKIWGFAQTHMSGTGVPDLGDILLQPFTGNTDRENYHSSFSKSTEKATPGYYSVLLGDYGVKAELTATAHTAFHQYTYPEHTTARLLVDLQSGLVSNEKQLREHVLESEVQFRGDSIISGFSRVNRWVSRNYYYVIVFNKPIVAKKLLPKNNGEKAPRYVLEFNLKPGEKLKVKIGLSTVSTAGAMNNMMAESPAWNFDAIKQKAAAEWLRYLSRVQIVGNNDQKTNFYTSLYHLLIQPNNIADTDGRYRGANNQVYQSSSKVYYSTLSLWDTYRAAHPLYTILTPEKVNGFINTMLDHYDNSGILPVWTLWGKENYCMIGNHAVPVVADAYLKGFRGFDTEKAFKAVKASLTIDHPKSDWAIYDRYKYLPFDLVKEESVSRTLEYAYDDYAASQMANAMGKKNEFEFFKMRAQRYKNLFDADSKLMRGKDSAGQWRIPFNKLRLSHAGTAGGDYTEGNAWQYTWSVQHDVNGLMEMLGGRQKAIAKLDSLFKLSSQTIGTGFTGDVTGLIGQYAHGNEPSHHVAYLYTLFGEPAKTQEVLSEIMERFYVNKPDGLSGNDDCGQMSAWYIFTAMGFYPVNPVGGIYVLGAPQLPQVTLNLTKGKRLNITAIDLSPLNKYVQRILWNGKVYLGNTISHQQIMNGGHLLFEMGPIKKTKTR